MSFPYTVSDLKVKWTSLENLLQCNGKLLEQSANAEYTMEVACTYTCVHKWLVVFIVVEDLLKLHISSKL